MKLAYFNREEILLVLDLNCKVTVKSVVHGHGSDIDTFQIKREEDEIFYQHDYILSNDKEGRNELEREEIDILLNTMEENIDDGAYDEVWVSGYNPEDLY